MAERHSVRDVASHSGFEDGRGQGMWAASGSWERQENTLPSSLRKERSSANTWRLAQRDPLGLPAFRTVR